ncbi:MAG: hypothetical protein SYR96_40250 [Actinomycetota bacterium]|nr:hypothetical protein [Actinomycetota bacterium]
MGAMIAGADAVALVAAGYDPAEEFIFGLDLVLAALEPLRASA